MSGDPKGGIDPSKLKLGKLRGVLFDSGIEFPSNAKKSELVALYLNHSRKFSTEPVIIEDSVSDDETRETKGKAHKSEENEAYNVNPVGIKEDSVDVKVKPAVKKEVSTGVEEKYMGLRESSADDSKNTDLEAEVQKSSKKSKKSKKKKKARQISTQLEDATQAKTNDKEDYKEDSRQMDSNIGATNQNLVPDKQAEEDINSKIEQDLGSLVSGKSEKPSPNVPEQGDATPKERQSRKRKSMLDEIDLHISATPSKGNIFEVESDSESELLSVRKKKPKRIPSSPKTPISNHIQSPKLTLTKLETTKDAQVPEPVEIAVGSGVAVNSQTNQPLKPLTSEVDREVNSRPKIDAPILREIPEDPPSAESSSIVSDSTGEPSIWFKTQQSFDEHHGLRSDQNASVSRSFDHALSKLKKETRSEDLRASVDQNIELTKLLNMDLSSVMPKSRNITPKRPIIISQRLLSSSKKSHVIKRKETFTDDEEDDDDDDNPNILDLCRAHSVEVTPEPSAKSQHTLSTAATKKYSFSKALTYIFIWLTLVGALLFGYWHREQTFLVGYCGTQIDHETIPDTPETSKLLVGVGKYLDNNFKPTCVECPPHARCFSRLELVCYEDFVVSAPWYYSYIPSFNLKAQRCVPDTKKAEKIEIMIDVALDLLRARNANENCGRSDIDNMNTGLKVSELHDLLLALKAPYITEEEFEELWERSVVELEKEPEIIVKPTTYLVAPAVDTNDTVAETRYEDKVLRSTSLSHISFTCMISNTVFCMILKFKKVIAILAFVCVAATASYWKYQQHKRHAHKIDMICHEVLSNLRKQAKLGRASRELPGYIGSVQLRDLILINEPNLAYKMRLWQDVSSKIDRNTNVKHELLEVHGEVMKVWEWISVIE